MHIISELERILNNHLVQIYNLQIARKLNNFSKSQLTRGKPRTKEMAEMGLNQAFIQLSHYHAPCNSVTFIVNNRVKKYSLLQVP